MRTQVMTHNLKNCFSGIQEFSFLRFTKRLTIDKNILQKSFLKYSVIVQTINYSQELTKIKAQSGCSIRIRSRNQYLVKKSVVECNTLKPLLDPFFVFFQHRIAIGIFSSFVHVHTGEINIPIPTTARIFNHFQLTRFT